MTTRLVLKYHAQIEELLTDPTSTDTDRDTIPDGFEGDIRCLNPLVDDSKVVNFVGDVINSTEEILTTMGVQMWKSLKKERFHVASFTCF